jgi:hypothetical protein
VAAPVPFADRVQSTSTSPTVEQVVTPLPEELLLLTLDPSQPRNTRRHDGIRASLCAAGVLDGWLDGSPLPPEKELRRHIRKCNFGTLEPALEGLVASGRVTTSGGSRRRLWWALPFLMVSGYGVRRETLVDVAAGVAVRARLAAALAAPQAPARRDAALAVLLYSGRLWNWSGLEEPSTEEVRLLGRRREASGPLKARAAELASGALVPSDAAPDDLPAVARVIDHEYRAYRMS